jgi:hypothetical protein
MAAQRSYTRRSDPHNGLSSILPLSVYFLPTSLRIASVTALERFQPFASA